MCERELSTTWSFSTGAFGRVSGTTSEQGGDWSCGETTLLWIVIPGRASGETLPWVSRETTV